jgi:hypothetical protein
MRRFVHNIDVVVSHVNMRQRFQTPALEQFVFQARLYTNHQSMLRVWEQFRSAKNPAQMPFTDVADGNPNAVGSRKR